MKEFIKYPSIENHYRERHIDLIRASDIDLNDFVATEKIHGANFSFWVNSEGVKIASRNGFVDGSFYSCTDVVNRYKDKIVGMFDAIRSGRMHQGIMVDSIVVYGELYGKGIQKEINYGDKDFIVFDIVINSDSSFTYLAKSLSLFFCEHYDIPFVPIIDFGKLDELLAIDVETLKTSVGPYKTDIAEGIIIEPNKPTFHHNGSRLIIKKKSKIFTEKSAIKEKKQPTNLSDKANALYTELLSLNNKARLMNVVSHYGQQNRSDFGKVIGLVTLDIIEDIEKNEPNLLELDQAERKRVQKMLTATIATLIKENWDSVFKD